MKSYQDMVNRRKSEHGDKFSDAALAKQFVQYYENGKRIKVRFPDGSTECGTVGASLGWIPCFLLMHKKTDLGSSTVLGSNDKIVGVQVGKKYLPI